MRLALLLAALALAGAALPSSAAAQDWSPPVLLQETVSTGAHSPDPEVAIDAAGNAIAVWDRLLGTVPNRYNRVMAAYRPAGGSWGTAQAISPTGASATDHDVAIGPAGNAIVVWSRDDADGTARVEFSERLANGSWSAVGTVSPDGGDANRPTVAFDGAGNATIAWSRYNTYYQVQATTRPVGGDWGGAEDLSSGDAHSLSIQLAPGPASTLHAAWERTVGVGTAEVYTAFRSAGGVWTAMDRRSDDTLQSAGSVRIASDPSGRATLVWSMRTKPQGPERWVQSATSSGGNLWTTPVDVSAQSPNANGMALGNDAQLAVDGAGTATALWQQLVGGSIRLQSASRPVGGGWSAPVTFPGANPFDGTYSASLGVSAAGTATATWGQRVGASAQVESGFRLADGSWSAPTAHTAAGRTGDPDIAVNPSGAATIVWTNSPTSTHFQTWAITRATDPVAPPAGPPTDPPAGPPTDPPTSPRPGVPPAQPKRAAITLGGITQAADGSVALAVTVNQAGRLTARATVSPAQLAKKKRKRPTPVVVAETTKRPAAAGRVKLRLVPKGRKAKRRLKAAGRLSARLTVTFEPKAGGKTTSKTRGLVFKSKPNHRSRRD